MNENSLNDTTCFSAHKKLNKNCQNKKCRYWHELGTNNNCIINKSSDSLAILPNNMK